MKSTFGPHAESAGASCAADSVTSLPPPSLATSGCEPLQARRGPRSAARHPSPLVFDTFRAYSEPGNSVVDQV